MGLVIAFLASVQVRKLFEMKPMDLIHSFNNALSQFLYFIQTIPEYKNRPGAFFTEGCALNNLSVKIPCHFPKILRGRDFSTIVILILNPLLNSLI